MNFFSKSLFIFTISSTSVFAENSLPAILCVDANEYWDGPYTVEVSKPDASGLIFASIYQQSDSGRLLVSEIEVNKLTEKNFVLNGENFELNMETCKKDQPNDAWISFNNGILFLQGDYSCLLLD